MRSTRVENFRPARLRSFVGKNSGHSAVVVDIQNGAAPRGAVVFVSIAMRQFTKVCCIAVVLYDAFRESLREEEAFSMR